MSKQGIIAFIMLLFGVLLIWLGATGNLASFLAAMFAPTSLYVS
nr:hypothetical protein [Alicyclobacillus tolerans]